MLRALKRNPVIQEHLASLSYYATPHAEKAAQEAVMQITREYVSEMTTLNANPDAWAALQSYLTSRRFFAFVRDLNRGLNHLERQELLRRAADMGYRLPLDIKQYQLDFETKVMADFESWMNEEGHKSEREKLRRVLAQRKFSEDMVIDSVRPRNSYGVTTNGIALTLGFAGIAVGLGVDPSIDYAQFLPWVAEWMTQWRTEILVLSSTFTIVPLTAQILAHIRLRWKFRGVKLNYPIRTNDVTKLPRWVSRRHLFPPASCRQSVR